MQKKQLKIGFLITQLKIPSTQATLLSSINQDSILDLTVIHINKKREPRPIFFDLYQWIENPIMRLLKKYPRPVQLNNKEYKLKSIDEIINQANDSNQFDVIINFCGTREHAQLSNFTRYGLWTLIELNGLAPFSSLTCFHEILQGKKVIETAIHIRRQGHSELLIYKSASSSYILSLTLVISQVLAKSQALIINTLKQLNALGWQAITQLQPIENPVNQKSKASSLNNIVILKASLQYISNFISYVFHRVVYNSQWFVAIRITKSANDEIHYADTSGYIPLKAPANRFYADPFLFQHNEQTYLFIEDYSYKDKKGVISVAQLDKTGKITIDFKPIIVTDYHLSYPHVFTYKGEVYLIPESGAMNRVELWKCDAFPEKWSLHKILLEGNYRDATFYYHDYTCWLFASIRRKGVNVGNELHLYYADTLFGPWHSHPQNPVSLDVRRARPAGNIFIDNNQRIIRPSQDCSHHYGGAINFNHVDILNRNEYLECEQSSYRIDCDWHPRLIGTHTYNKLGQLEVIDGNLRRLKII